MTKIVNHLVMNDKKRDEVIKASEQVFTRYGYNRVTMSDIAKAAGMSRPALYLIFKSKEDVFSATAEMVFERTLSIIKADKTEYASVEERLNFIFDAWFMEPHRITTAYPDASDLIESVSRYAHEVKEASFQEFTQIVAGILKKMKARPGLHFNHDEVSKMMADAVLGFKLCAKSEEDLSKQIKCLIRVSLANFQ